MAPAAAAAVVVGVTALTTAYSTRTQQITANKAETRARGIAENERQRQAKQESLLKGQEFDQSKRAASSLKALTGGRGGRRSLMSAADEATAGIGDGTTLG